MDQYLNLIKYPKLDARGKTRWWWYGCAVTKDEIKKQLTYMNDANIGGVEIQITYPINEDNEDKKIKNLPYFSPEFFDVIKYTTKKADELGLTVDFTLGSGWPFGGAIITHEMSPQSVIPYQIDVYGPKKLSYDFTTKINGKIIQTIMGKMEKGIMLEDSIVDINNYIKTKYLFNWPWGYEIKDLHIPEGDYKIVVFVIAQYRQLIGVPAPNMSGFVIDHCRKDVSDYFFSKAGTPIVEKIGKGKIKSFFCDSIEVSGQNWTANLFEEFKKRRGYDLALYIYGLWGEISAITPYIRHDYYLTMSELTIENFFENFTTWCNKNGSKSRIQAHGTWGDILKAYGSADIPEGETFGENDYLSVNTIHRRLASSAGHIYQKSIISNETFTWLRTPRFLVTLENMKAAVDAVFLDGINLIYNHGYSYTPETVGSPGWVFYASTHICHTNTWWPYYKELGSYIQKVTSFMQIGRHVSEIAIYLPQHDVWAENTFGDLHLAMKLEEYMGKSVVDDINKKGYYFDYINDEALLDIGKVVTGGLAICENIYQVIILLSVKKIPVEIALKFKEFVINGGTLIAAETIPNDSCRFLDREKNKIKINKIISELFNQSGKCKKVGKGKTCFSKDKYDQLIYTLENAIKPDVKIMKHSNKIGYVHRKDNYNDIYFVSNISSEYLVTDIKFKTIKKGVMIIDPMNEETVTPKTVTYNKKTTTITLSFDPFQSYIIVFSPDYQMDIGSCYKQEETKSIIDISSDWTLKVSEKDFVVQMSKIKSWESYETLAHYSGAGYYSKSIIVTEKMLSAKKVLLELEEVREIAEILINNQLVGVLWKNPRIIDIKKELVIGENEVIIKVTNLLINDAINPEKTNNLIKGSTITEWPYFPDVINHIVTKRLHNNRERKKIKKPLKSGIDGSVKIKF